MPPLQLDDDGNIVIKPVTGWTTRHLAQAAILLVVNYVDTPEELEIEESKAIQLAMKPAQRLQLAEALTMAAKTLLPATPGTIVH
jgi:hypothetical protein